MAVAASRSGRRQQRQAGRTRARPVARGGTPSGQRIVVLCLVGLSPAVVTETLYALAVRRRPRVVPDELHIVTTREGAAKVTATLLGPQGALAELGRQYRLRSDVFRCPLDHVHMLVDARGDPLDDIVTSADSEVVGEQLATIVQQLGASRGFGRPTSIRCWYSARSP